MLRPCFAPRLLRNPARRLASRSPYSTAPKLSDPLRILFCGSDHFSCASLQALHDEHKHNAELIRSIDVLVRPSKPTGRGYKVMREVPLRTLAEELGLPIHVRDTFTGWDMPEPDGQPINLIIAVSFGLFVPPRLIHASKYGGLNVHPSLLPDLRGPAPIHHALLARRSHTGVSVQTLSALAFDAGIVLRQTPPPGIPVPPDCTVPQLHDLLAPAGARMLLEVLRAGLHVLPQPPVDAGTSTTTATAAAAGVGVSVRVGYPGLRHAPKITPDDRQVLWTTAVGGGGGGDAAAAAASATTGDDNARGVALRARVLGPLWTHIRWRRRRKGSGAADGRVQHEEEQDKRAILEDVSVSFGPSGSLTGSSSGGGGGGGVSQGKQQDGGRVVWVQKPSNGKKGERAVIGDEVAVETEYLADGDGEAVLVQMPDGSWLRIGKIKLDGSTSKPALRVLESMRSK